MNITWKHILTFLLCLLVGVIIGVCLKGCSSEPTVEPTPIHDTIFRTDTLIQTKTKIRYITKIDTLLITNTDTISIEIPIEHKEYADSIITDSSRIAWNVQYSGYKAKIDTFALDYTLQPQVRVEKKENGWGSFVGIGIGVGGGIGLVDGKLQPTPHAGLHIVYGWGYHWKRIKKK